MNDNQRRVMEIVGRIQAEYGPGGTPGITPLTSNQMKARADNRRYIATQLKLQGKEVKEDFR